MTWKEVASRVKIRQEDWGTESLVCRDQSSNALFFGSGRKGDAWLTFSTTVSSSGSVKIGREATFAMVAPSCSLAGDGFLPTTTSG